MPVPGPIPLNHNSIHTESPACRCKARNRLRFYQRSITSPKAAEIPLFTSAIKMQQVCLVTGSVVTKPSIDIDYADLMEHRESVTGGLSLISDERGNHIFIHGRSVLPANFKQSRVHVPLDGVSKKVRQ